MLTDVTSGIAVLGIMGPRSRALLQSLSPDDLGSEAFPFGTSREIELGLGYARASRITYVGELGWELYIPTEFAAGIYDALVEAGEDVGLRHVGMHAMNSLRIEKAYRHYGHDITDADTPLEAGLGFAVKLEKPGGFIGREALLRQREEGPAPAPGPVPARGPGAAALPQRADLAGRCDLRLHPLRHVRPHPRRRRRPRLCRERGGVDADYVNAGRYEIEVAGVRYPARASLRPLYDPTSGRIKA